MCKSWGLQCVLFRDVYMLLVTQSSLAYSNCTELISQGAPSHIKLLVFGKRDASPTLARGQGAPQAVALAPTLMATLWQLTVTWSTLMCNTPLHCADHKARVGVTAHPKTLHSRTLSAHPHHTF